MSFRRGNTNFKNLTIIVLFGLLVIFGFREEYNSGSQNLERNHINQHQMSTKVTSTRAFGAIKSMQADVTLNSEDEKILKLFLSKLSSKSTKRHDKLISKNKKSLSEDDESKTKPKKKSEFERSVKSKKTHKPEKESKIITNFPTPPNIFHSNNLGENGTAVVMPSSLSPEIEKIMKAGWKNNQFNQYLSDLISVNRSLPDIRHDYCKEAVSKYGKKLPATSVIIIFHNEAWSTLLRSVHSVLNRSPEHLIAEIILVDDCSTMGEETSL